MARGATVNLAELPPERKAEIAEQAQRHQEEADRWNEMFDGLAERVLAPTMQTLVDELREAERWVGDSPKSHRRMSGTGVKIAGKFRGAIEGRERPIELDLELFPSTGGRFIAYLEVNGVTEREPHHAEDFQNEPDENEERLQTWLDSQIERRIRGKAFS